MRERILALAPFDLNAYVGNNQLVITVADRFYIAFEVSYQGEGEYDIRECEELDWHKFSDEDRVAMGQATIEELEAINLADNQARERRNLAYEWTQYERLKAKFEPIK